MTISSPRWLQDLQRLLPIRSQFVLSGNIRDSYISPVAAGNALVPLTRCLWESVRQQGFQFLLIFDPADGLRVYPDEPAARDLATRLFDLKLCDGLQMISLESLSKLMRKLSQEREARCALIVDFASRLARHHEQLTEAEHRFLWRQKKLTAGQSAGTAKHSWQTCLQPGDLATEPRAGFTVMVHARQRTCRFAGNRQT
jgi:hypothetical protein